MQEMKQVILGETGILEAILAYPDEIATPSHVALVCHPHPLHGGTMNNKVVTTLVKACVNAGIAALRFNYRGVGNSQGEYDEGRGEVLDAKSSAEWLKEYYPQSKIIIMGFSFGAAVSYVLSQEIRIAGLVLVAPPVERFDFSSSSLPDVPWWVIQPDADEVVSPQAVYDWIETIDKGKRPTVIRFPGTSHFFHGQLVKLREQVEIMLEGLMNETQ